jgi:hypothetical protein
MIALETFSLRKQLIELGLYDAAYAGIQVDLNAARRKLLDGRFVDASLCDHNCLETPNGGKYTCPASISMNKGIISQLAPAEKIIEGVRRSADALYKVRDYLLSDEFFGSYCSRFKVPSKVGEVVKEILREGNIEVNLFGGNPEMHSELPQIIAALKNAGYSVTLTTTGRRFMIDKNFLEKILSNPPDTIAVSADDFEDVEQIKRLASLSSSELFSEWKMFQNIMGNGKKLTKLLTQQILGTNIQKCRK